MQEKRRKSLKLEGGFELSKCEKCLRTFKPDRLKEHERFCAKRAYTPTKPITVALTEMETPTNTATFAAVSPP